MRCLSLSTPVYLSLFLSVCLSLSLSVSVSFELLEGDITEPEVYTAVRALKNGKAAGPDGIIGEFFKTSATLVVPFLVKLFNRLFTTGSYPVRSNYSPAAEKGDANNPDNYRGISLLNICSELYSHILNNRLNK